jgi:hypothetical protein
LSLSMRRAKSEEEVGAARAYSPASSSSSSERITLRERIIADSRYTLKDLTGLSCFLKL